MAKMKIRVNSSGLMAAARNHLSDDVDKAAEKVAGKFSGVSTGTQKQVNRSGRPVSLVALTEVNGLAIEAKRGTLTNAARAAGLKVRRQ